ncbi:NAD-dependent epimerase/dehydratase family protein [Archangium sp.]|uniref:NAD-dependent epimerase/dehydratase family protein n=1 Tax=Archangium sp. TaxID=1872627 RepID=UPI00389A4088
MDSSRYLFMTGPTGFVGSNALRHLTRHSAARPWSAIKVLVRGETGAEQARALGAEPVRGDLLDPSPMLREVISGARYVLHCADAAWTSSYAEARARMDENLIGAINPHHVARAVYVCGSSYFGASEDAALIDERTPPRPLGLGPAFGAGLRALRTAGERGLDYVAAFVSGVYGPGSWFTRQYLHQLEQEQPIPVLEPPAVWPYIHIEDCVRALEFLLTLEPAKLETAGREVILTDDTPVPMTTFIEELARVTGRTARLERLERGALQARLPPFEFSYQSANMLHSNARLRGLGFECKYPSVKEGVPALELARR